MSDHSRLVFSKPCFFHCLLSMLFLMNPLAVLSADIYVVDWKGVPALVIDGPIETGDFDSFVAQLDLVEVHAHGAKVVLLNSLGGKVGEALKISEYLDNNLVHMVVPAEASCASACASILFVGGHFRTVEEGGRIGQHSCSIEGVASPECNELISQHAVANNVSYGSISAFITYVEPDDILWFSREDVDCWGVSMYPFQYGGAFNYKSEPCFFRNLTGEVLEAQIGWRVDLLEDGFIAFSRRIEDHIRELQVGMHCRESDVGNIYLTVEIGGNSEIISEAIYSGQVLGHAISDELRPVRVAQVDEVYSRASMVINRREVLFFLQFSGDFLVKLNLDSNYDDIVVPISTVGSLDALLFAANNCPS